MSIPLEQVQYTPYTGDGDIDSWIAQACAIIGVNSQPYWDAGYKTLTYRESTYNPNAINITDDNAVGSIVADGNPQGCSRGIAQCIPATFASYYAENTSLSIYDPVANIAASMQYIMATYGVSSDGSNLQANVQQADPTQDPHGY
ncbi:transglycosylase SLT domain-containing protein [Nostoc sp.]|uniref:transglycosylase SLT domain-containing protein n=1 Tax=Nostoc sp. TaxID=1180 RepID=UPI002FF960FB